MILNLNVEYISLSQAFILINSIFKLLISFILSIIMRKQLAFLLISYLIIGCKPQEVLLIKENPPTVITKPTSDVSLSSATMNGEVTDEGFTATTDRGFVYSEKNTNPSVSDTKVQSGYGKGIYSVKLDKLTLDTKYYYKSYATNTKGTVYGEVQSFSTLKIGDSYQGGILTYILTPSDQGYDKNILHGFITSNKDISTSAQWGCFGQNMGAGYQQIGMGKYNTNTIVINCADQGIAAKLCRGLTDGGFLDWFLPSIKELDELYKNRIKIGGFNQTFYWSSTDYYKVDAYGTYFSGNNAGWSATSALRDGGKAAVRCIRSF